MSRTALIALVGALFLAGCSSGDGGSTAAATTASAPATTAATTGETAPDPVPGESVADVVERVLPSVVNVRTTIPGGGRGEGSGVVLSADGMIATNNHVVDGATAITVAFNDGRHPQPLAATVIGTAPERDLAVLQVDATDLVPIELARSSALRLGDELIAIGFPLGLGGPTVTRGIVSGLDRTIEPEGGARLEGLLQTDAAINPGNSGGALVDRAGRLIGINTARAGLADNIGFAIAIDEALPVIDRLRTTPVGSQAWLGAGLASVESDGAAAALGLDPAIRGVRVVEVFRGGPAADAGLELGDVIVALDGRTIASASDLARALAERQPGETVELELIDTQGPRLAELKLGRRPEG